MTVYKHYHSDKGPLARYSRFLQFLRKEKRAYTAAELQGLLGFAPGSGGYQRVYGFLHMGEAFGLVEVRGKAPLPEGRGGTRPLLWRAKP